MQKDRRNFRNEKTPKSFLDFWSTVIVSIIYGGFVSAVASAAPLRCSAAPLRCLCGASAVPLRCSAVPLRCLCGASADAPAVKEQTSEKRMNGQKRAKNETERRAKGPP